MVWIYIIAYLFAFGILSSIAVRKKNRDQVGWFFIGFLFGVFGFLAAVLVENVQSSDKPSIQAQQFDPSSLTKKCPDCAETIKLEAKVCRFCQHRFSEKEVEEQIRFARQEYEKTKQGLQEVNWARWQCPNCYHFNEGASNHCSNCKYIIQNDAALRLR